MKTNEQKEAIESLKEMLKPGDTVYTVVKHVSKSGMTRHIQPYIVRDGKIESIGWYVARALDWSLVKGTHQIKVGGAGMDMCFHLVYTLGRVLYGGTNVKDAGYSFNNETI